MACNWAWLLPRFVVKYLRASNRSAVSEQRHPSAASYLQVLCASCGQVPHSMPFAYSSQARCQAWSRSQRVCSRYWARSLSLRCLFSHVPLFQGQGGLPEYLSLGFPRSHASMLFHRPRTSSRTLALKLLSDCQVDW